MEPPDPDQFVYTTAHTSYGVFAACAHDARTLTVCTRSYDSATHRYWDADALTSVIPDITVNRVRVDAFAAITIGDDGTPRVTFAHLKRAARRDYRVVGEATRAAFRKRIEADAPAIVAELADALTRAGEAATRQAIAQAEQEVADAEQTLSEARARLDALRTP